MFEKIKSMLKNNDENVLSSAAVRFSDAPKIISHVEGVRDVAIRTEETYAEAIKTFVRGVNEDPKLSEIDVAMIAQYRQFMRENYGAVTYNSRMRTIRAILNKLYGRGLISRSFSEQFKMRPEPPKAVKAITEENKNAMLLVADIKWQSLINILWFTGCRRGGLRSMRVQDFRVWEDDGTAVGSLKVVEKADRPRSVFIKGSALESLQLHLRMRPFQTSDYLFAGRYGGQLSRNIITTMLARIARRAHIPKTQPTNPHAFRHAFAIRNLDSQISPEIVADWMGIDVMTMLRYYTTRDDNRLRELYRQHAVV